MISNNDIIITPYIDFDVTIIFHSDGREHEVQLDDIADISINARNYHRRELQPDATG